MLHYIVVITEHHVNTVKYKYKVCMTEQGRAGQRDRVAEQGDGTEQQRSTGQQSRVE